MFDIQTYPAAQKTENYAEDVLAHKFGQPAGDHVPALIFDDGSNRKFKRSLRLLGNLTFEEACQHSILDFSDDLPKFATLANIALVVPVSSVPCEFAEPCENLPTLTIDGPVRHRLKDFFLRLPGSSVNRSREARLTFRP